MNDRQPDAPAGSDLRLSEHALAPTGAAVVATVMWAAGNLIVVGVDMPGSQLAFWRTLLGAATFQAIFRLRGGRMSMDTIRTAAFGGASFGVSAVLFFSAFKATTVASATVIAALQPVLLLPYSVKRLGEQVDAAKVALVGLAVLGTAAVVLSSSDSSGDWSLRGDLLAVGGTLAGCAYFVGTKRARETLGAIEYQGAALVVGALVALVATFVVGPGLSVPTGADLGAAALMVAIPGTGHVLMSWSQKHLAVSDTATIALGVTVLSSLGAAVFYDQELGPVQLVGMALVLLSLAIFVRRASGVPPVDPAEVPVTPGE